VATLAHPAEGEFGNRSDTAASMRRVLERAVDSAPSHIRPPRGRLRRLFARDRSARALVKRYRLWPAIEHAYNRVTRQYGSVRLELAVRLNLDDEESLWMEFYGDVPESDDVFEFESTVRGELWDILGKRGRYRLPIHIYRDYSRFGDHELRS